MQRRARRRADEMGISLEDIHMVDFKRPNGEPVMRTVAITGS